MAYLKKDAPPEVLETLGRAEAQADECWRPLRIVGNPASVAVWALLVGGIGIVEREQATRGSNTPHFDATLEPRDGIAIIEFDAFARVLSRSNSLREAVGELLTYDWLPVEGRDFYIRYDRATANGVSIESQVFYSTEPAG